MDGLSLSLVLAAAGIGVLHTLLGPDHYLPFVAMARAQNWSWRRTLTTVGLCGIGHVAGSLLLGAVGVGIGVAVGRIESLESGRSDWAAWTMVAFGGAYALWGLRQALLSGSGLSPHAHGPHLHIHRHGAHSHEHENLRTRRFSFWAMLLVFILGPCEALLPLFVLPASRGRWDVALVTVAVFAITTVLTMFAATAVGILGLRRLRAPALERWGHAFAGGMVTFSGLAIITFGL